MRHLNSTLADVSAAPTLLLLHDSAAWTLFACTWMYRSVALTARSVPCAFRWIRDARELRLQRKVQRMRLQSDAAQLQRELHQLQGQLQAERRHQQSHEQELRQVQRARLAHSAGQSGWQLGAVQLYHNRVVQATPVRVSTCSTLQRRQSSSKQL